jgi:hypothetical protein
MYVSYFISAERSTRNIYKRIKNKPLFNFKMFLSSFSISEFHFLETFSSVDVPIYEWILMQKYM